MFGSKGFSTRYPDEAAGLVQEERLEIKSLKDISTGPWRKIKNNS